MGLAFLQGGVQAPILILHCADRTGGTRRTARMAAASNFQSGPGLAAQPEGDQPNLCTGNGKVTILGLHVHAFTRHGHA